MQRSDSNTETDDSNSDSHGDDDDDAEEESMLTPNTTMYVMFLLQLVDYLCLVKTLISVYVY